MDIVLVLGNEQKGISPSIKRICHDIVGIPSPNRIDSLNVAVAEGIILSEIYRQMSHLSS
jgi:tRNA G18 (ribose-2'-O)-methylase SpoU